MEILIVNGFANRQGGADVYTENLALKLSNIGHNINIICFDASINVSTTCRITKVLAPNHKHWPLLWRITPILTESYWRSCILKLNVPTPEVVINSLPLCEHALNTRFPFIPRIYMPHSRIAPLEASRGLDNGILKYLTHRTFYNSEKHAIENSFTTVRFTRGLVDVLIDYYNLKAACSFHIIPQAIDVIPKTYQQRTGTFRILSAGRLIPSKNLALLLSSLDESIKGDWQLDILGDGPDCNTLKRMISSPILKSRINFLGHQNNISEYYSKADLLAFPSKLENLSLVVLEAMAHGVPALVIRADNKYYFNSHHEVLQHGYNGLIAKDEIHFAMLLRSCIDNPSIARNLATNSCASASSYSWDAAIGKWEKLLLEARVK